MQSAMSVLLEPGIENKVNALEKKISALISDLGKIKKRLAALEKNKRGDGNQGFRTPGDEELQGVDDQGCSVS